MAALDLSWGSDPLRCSLRPLCCGVWDRPRLLLRFAVLPFCWPVPCGIAGICCGCVCSIGCRHHSPGAPVGCLKPPRRACQDVRRSAGGLVDVGLDWPQPWQLACSAGCLQSHCLHIHVAIVLRSLSSRMAARFGQEPWCSDNLMQSVANCNVDSAVGSDNRWRALVRSLRRLRCHEGSVVAEASY